jgi:hypothetical protein
MPRLSQRSRRNKRRYSRKAAGSSIDLRLRVRLREAEVDAEVLGLFDRIKQPASVQNLFVKAITAWTTKKQSRARSRASGLQGQLDDVRRQQERLLNVHLAGTIDEQAFGVKNLELRDRVAKLTLQLEATDRKKDETADLALRVFELSQNLKKQWYSADFAAKRRLLNLICLNFVLKGVSLVISTRKPFNSLVEGLVVSDSGERGIRTPETLARLQHFQCCSFSRSDTSPGGFWLWGYDRWPSPEAQIFVQPAGFPVETPPIGPRRLPFGKKAAGSKVYLQDWLPYRRAGPQKAVKGA